MNTMRFKTNIKCSGCEEKVTPVLNKIAGEHNWKVDLQTPEKLLTVQAAPEKERDIIDALSEVGYKAEPIA